jgi:hypothetical protein
LITEVINNEGSNGNQGEGVNKSTLSEPIGIPLKGTHLFVGMAGNGTVSNNGVFRVYMMFPRGI